MRKFSRLVALSVLLTSSWLTAYQIGDAAEDAVADLNCAAQIVSPPGVRLSKPVAPDTDEDGAIPVIANQTLLPTAHSLSAPSRGSGPFEIPPAQRPLTMQEIARHTLSPPRFAGAPPAEALALRHSRVTARLRALAPPSA